jgi:hypothetical protein
MADLDLRQITPEGKAPKTRIADATSLNNVIKKIVQRDLSSALARQDVQQAVDGKPPFEEQWLRESGQEGRCNLNFQDLKRRLKKEELGYYDLTESVPVLALVETEYDSTLDQAKVFQWTSIMSEEFHKLLKDWKSFDTYFQLLIKKFCTHGVGFLYFEDDLDWRWRVAGLEDFKMPRYTTLAEDELDIAVAFRDVTTAQLYQWVQDVDDSDKRWNKQEVYKAILKATDANLIFSQGEWEKWQNILKNNDIYAATTAQDTVKLGHAWVREYSGKVSQYMTLRNGGNDDFLYKCENRFDSVNECFTFFPYEVGTNGYLHSVRGLAHERFPAAQELNSLRCQSSDNARLSGSLLIQPKTATSAEDMALIFYGGVVYIPPEVEIQDGQLANPTQGLLPVIDQMSMLLQDSQPTPDQGKPPSKTEKTKFQVQKEAMDEAALPTASLNLFYQPWKRHLNEVWRRVNNKKLKQKDLGGKEVFEFRKRCMARGVPHEFLLGHSSWVEPYRAVGYGSPSNRLLALDEFMQYYGSLDPMGQNNLLRDRFAQKVGYAQVDRYVPMMQANGRRPYDVEIAELQNTAMQAGGQPSVGPNDAHILHLQIHLPSLEQILEELESGNTTPQLLQVATVMTQHCAQHLQLLKPDELQKGVVAELQREFNNDAQRTSAAMEHYQRQQAKQAQMQQEEQQKNQAQLGSAQTQQTLDQMKASHMQESHEQDLASKKQDMRMKEEAHQLMLTHQKEKFAQDRAIADAEAAAKAKQIAQQQAVKTT